LRYRGVASVSGNFFTYGANTFSGTGSSSFSGSLAITKGLRVTGNITNDVLSASRLVQTNGSKVLSSVSNLTSWIAGTTNQITVTDDGDGTVTLSTPQDIHTSATPQFSRLGLGTAPVTVLEVQGTSSASYGLFGALQVAGFSSASYSRFGTGTTGYSSDLDTANDLLISGALEIDGNAFFDGKASISSNFQIAGRFVLGDNGDTGEINTNDWDISNTGALTGIGLITADGILTIDDRAEFQGTASASYLLTGNTLQVGGFSSAAYSRFGTATTGHSNYISASNDLLISGDLEVRGTVSFGGVASISGVTSLNGIRYTWPSADGSANQFLQTNSSGALTWATAGVASNSLDFDEFVNSMTLDADLTINRAGFKIGLGAAPSTVFEVQGTASASYGLFGNTLQVGGYATVSYNRFGTSTISGPASNWITTSNDLLVSGDLYGVGSLAFQGPASLSNTLFVKSGNVGIGTTGPGAPLHVDRGDSAGTVAKFTSRYSISSVADIWITNPHASARNWAIGTNDGDFTFTVGTSSGADPSAEKIRIQDDGNVGIGTTAPGTQLHIKSASGTTANLRIDSSNANDESQIGFYINGVLKWQQAQQAAGNLIWYDGGDNQILFRVDASAQNDDGWETAAVDYAEWMKKLDPNEEILPFEVVGIKNGKVTKDTNDATFYMLTSSKSGIRGGNSMDTPRDNDKEWIVVAYVGQVPVLLKGEFKEGDYVMPSGRNDGLAVAVPSENIQPYQYKQVIGRVLNEFNYEFNETSDGGFEVELRNLMSRKGSNKIVNVVVGTSSGNPGIGMANPELKLDVRYASLSMTAEELMAKAASGQWGSGTSLQQEDNIGTGAFNFIVKKFNEVMDIVFEKGLLRVANIITEKITANLGSFKKFELEDEDTGEKYCVKVKSGQLISIKGECGMAEIDLISNYSNSPNQTPITNGQTTESSTPEFIDDGLTTSDGEATSDVTEPEFQPEADEPSAQIEPTPTPEVVPENTPEPTPEPSVELEPEEQNELPPTEEPTPEVITEAQNENAE